MIDLPEARALAARARGNTADGLTALEALPAVVEALAGELDRARSLRLERPADAVNPQRHTPDRVRAFLGGRGWRQVAERETYDVWQLGDDELAGAVLMSTKPQASDYAKRLGILLAVVAREHGTGELAVLAEIEAADA